MEKIKIFYKGAYDDGDCERYVYAKNGNDYLVITYRQWKNCLKIAKLEATQRYFLIQKSQYLF